MADRATATPASSATGVVLARQPILDADLNVQAFELLYRAVGADGRPVDGGRATATVLVAAQTSGSDSPIFPVLAAAVCVSVRLLGLKYGINVPIAPSERREDGEPRD